MLRRCGRHVASRDAVTAGVERSRATASAGKQMMLRRASHKHRGMSCCGVCYCGRQADGVAACVVGKQMLFCAVAADLVPRHALRRRGMLCYRGRQAEVAAGKHKHRARLERVAFRDCRAGNASRLPPILMPGNPSRISNWTPPVSKLLSWNASRLSRFASHSTRTLPIDYSYVVGLWHLQSRAARGSFQET